jgi:hypothetical protein
MYAHKTHVVNPENTFLAGKHSTTPIQSPQGTATTRVQKSQYTKEFPYSSSSPTVKASLHRASHPHSTAQHTDNLTSNSPPNQPS